MSDQTRFFTVALIGNPNTGKSTLFSALAGVHQHVGNYPGVTVEKKTGRMELGGRHIELIDLPGVYSIAPRSRDEMVTVDLLLGRREDSAPVDGVLCVVDAGNLDRGLYLLSQVLELGHPTILVLNMIDLAERHGIRVDCQQLKNRLGIPVVAIKAHRRVGLDKLRQAINSFVADKPPACAAVFPQSFEDEVTRLSALLKEDGERPAPSLPRALLRRLLLDMNGYLQESLLDGPHGRIANELEAMRSRLNVAGCRVPGVETSARYDWARQMLQGVVTEPRKRGTTITDRIDRVLTHRFAGLAVFILVMLAMFQAVFVWARPLMHWIELATTAAGHCVEAYMAEGALRSLLVDGIIGGVGGILAFLPQILILFGFLAVLEDCGYMARTAYLMDRIMVRVGLSGKSFIPLLSSFACAIPGIMATRIIEDERDRLTTILVTPLLTCSARLPIYTLMIAAFIPTQTYLGGILSLQGLTLAGLYVMGIVAAVVAALILKRTVLRGQNPPFVMELPSYKWPSIRTVVYRMIERGWIFLRSAGTLILAVSILVWAALYYPHDPDVTQAQQQQNSYLGRMGQVIEPVVKPLGWDWRIGCSVLASLPAREIVVATLGVMYNLGEPSDSESQGGDAEWHTRLREVTRDDTGEPVFNIPVALSIMVFFALCAQCAATLAVIRRETNSWRWPAFTFAYMTVLAYCGAFVTYQLGIWIGGS